MRFKGMVIVMFQESARKRRPIEIVGIVVIFILALAIVCTFVLYGIFKDSNTAPSLFGKRVYIMNGDGMEPRIKKGSAVFIEEGVMPEKSGNVILCNIDGRLAVVGYVQTQSTTMSDGSITTKYIVKYDNTPADQQWAINASDIIGRADSYDELLGAVIRFASSKTGLLLIVIVPCAILIVYEIIMLALAAKRKKLEAEYEQNYILGGEDDFGIIFAGDEESSDNSDKPESKSDLRKEEKRMKEEAKQKAKERTKDKPRKPRTDNDDEDVKFILPEAEEDQEPYDAANEESSPVPESTDEIRLESNVNDDPEPEDPVQSMTSRIDELIRILEEEKSRWSDKK